MNKWKKQIQYATMAAIIPGFIVVIFFMLLSVNVYSQNQPAKYEANNISCIDSADNRISTRIKFDIENIKYAETRYDSLNNKAYTKYYTRAGKEILAFNWDVAISGVHKLQDKIKESFNLNDLTACTGTAVVLLVIDGETSELRIIKGITDEFNKELLSVVRQLEKDLIFIYPNNSKAIVSPFPFTLQKR